MAGSQHDPPRWASALAQRHIGGVGTRLEHSRTAARLASAIAPAFQCDFQFLSTAALLHDVGYSPELATTGFHPLDGARHLRKQGHDELAGLIAHHTGARHEAAVRAVISLEVEFPFQDSPLDQALTFCDLTTSPWGTRMRFRDRIADIFKRYDSTHPTAIAIASCLDELEQAVADTEKRVATAGIVLSGSLAYPE